MARVVLEKLAPGMRLDKPVCNIHGVLLLKTGEVLTAKHLEIFKTWGIREVDVVREEGAEPESAQAVAVPPEVLQTAQARVAHRFRRVDPAADPVMAEILRVVTERLAQELATQRRA
ncbi:MAG TPA: hypothetical protein VLT62_00040 [Candidatus Methylomirabilis sp.]|nr:hypothetical protein [Candidatus Methylomirabilis sp.]